MVARGADVVAMSATVARWSRADRTAQRGAAGGARWAGAAHSGAWSWHAGVGRRGRDGARPGT